MTIRPESAQEQFDREKHQINGPELRRLAGEIGGNSSTKESSSPGGLVGLVMRERGVTREEAEQMIDDTGVY